MSQKAAAAEQVPEGPAHIGLRGWWGVFKRTVREFQKDRVVDLAAGLTYYALLSVFPALIVVVSLVGMTGISGTRTLVDNVRQLPSGQYRVVLIDVIESLEGTAPTASVFAAAGLALALWSASRYVAGFIRAVNVIYDMPEGRPVWKLAPLRLGLTLVMVLLLGVSAVAVAFTGRFAERAGEVLGLGSAFVTAWGVLKWPVILVVVMVAVATLYWAAPNVRQPGWRWITPGSGFAIVAWIAASAGFAVYVANFGSYNQTYGALAGVVIFLVWMWFSNVTLLLGAEVDAELARARHLERDGTVEDEPFIEPRDTRKMDERETHEVCPPDESPSGASPADERQPGKRQPDERAPDDRAPR
ncbi:YihY/virulence factor BrkB family protein [Spirillospora sp. NPDC047279]|uniref:YihY/virulence factor BrkB family protein n=1 Tax=Spirillospora sp. NPDC047279 TaxID=3155478 RepID=UPI0033FD844D